MVRGISNDFVTYVEDSFQSLLARGHVTVEFLESDEPADASRVFDTPIIIQDRAILQS
jgi:hypothetical protein